MSDYRAGVQRLYDAPCARFLPHVLPAEHRIAAERVVGHYVEYLIEGPLMPAVGITGEPEKVVIMFTFQELESGCRATGLWAHAQDRGWDLGVWPDLDSFHLHMKG